MTPRSAVIPAFICFALLSFACGPGPCAEGEARANDGQCVALQVGFAPDSELCDDQQDNDADGFVDCEDQDCNDNPNCPAAGDDDDSADADNSPQIELCDDNIDNDGDGFVDCDDQDCWSQLSCPPPGDDDDSAGDDEDSPTCTDADADNWCAEAGDCDDNNPQTSPVAIEVCDGHDNNCNGSIDETAVDAPSWYLDADQDGYGAAHLSQEACTAAPGYVANALDCDDLNPARYPGATEVCDELDNNCDGTVDEGAAAAALWYLDADGDGFGNLSAPTTSCTPPPGYVSDASDCDDFNAAVNSTAAEVCDQLDNNCDGATDEGAAAPTLWYVDADGDGQGNAAVSVTACVAPPGHTDTAGDCDDLDATSSSTGIEVCDGADNDCDQSIDEGVTSTFYVDNDGDGYGDPGATLAACFLPGAASANALDCDDGSPAAHPGGVEICDGLDNDCDGSADNNALNATSWYVDADGDGFGDPLQLTIQCGTIAGAVTNGLDCDDSAGGQSNYPGNTEICDGADNDCDNDTDEDFDLDEDNFTSCGADGSAGTADDDCDDNDPGSFPGNAEVCDGADNDCDSNIDEDFDGDGDGVTSCGADGSAGTADDDCSDSDPANFPGNSEACDGADNDCDGSSDEGFDGDGDGVPSCGNDGDPTTAADNDCDDSDDDNFPGNSEACDGADNDCDLLVDEGVAGFTIGCPAGDCKALYEAGERNDGSYWINANGVGAAFQVACDMSNDGGGWTLVAKTDGSGGHSHLSASDSNIGALATTATNDRGTLGNTRRNGLGPFYRFECDSFTRWAYQNTATNALDHWSGTSPVAWSSSYSTDPANYTDNNAQDCGSPTCDGPAYAGRNWARQGQNGCGLGGTYGRSGLWWAK